MDNSLKEKLMSKKEVSNKENVNHAKIEPLNHSGFKRLNAAKKNLLSVDEWASVVCKKEGMEHRMHFFEGFKAFVIQKVGNKPPKLLQLAEKPKLEK